MGVLWVVVGMSGSCGGGGRISGGGREFQIAGPHAEMRPTQPPSPHPNQQSVRQWRPFYVSLTNSISPPRKRISRCHHVTESRYINRLLLMYLLTYSSEVRVWGISMGKYPTFLAPPWLKVWATRFGADYIPLSCQSRHTEAVAGCFIFYAPNLVLRAKWRATMTELSVYYWCGVYCICE